jgi:hypothetical protein
MTPAQFYALEQNNQQNRQEFMQGQQQQLMQGLGQLAGAYAENKQMKNDAKIYGELLKFAGPAIGDTKGDLLASYKQMGEREQANFGRTLFGGGLFPTMAQSYNFGRNAGIRENAPFVGAGLKNAADLGAGRGTYGTPRGETTVEPDLPAMDNNRQPGVFNRDTLGMYAPSQDSLSASRNWASGYFGKLNPNP